MFSRYDIQGLADELEISIEEIAPLFSNYFTEMNEEIEEMLVCLDKEDWYMLERTVHNIKGVSANLRIEDVFDEAAAFDLELKADITGNAESRVKKLSELIGTAEIEVKAYFNEEGFTI